MEDLTDPGTVMMQFTRLLLCKGRRLNVRTCCVRLIIPRTAMPPPVSTPPVVITAAPPAPARKPVVPVIPMVLNAAPRPTPMTGAKSPADRPITSPPPSVARPSIMYRFFLLAFLRPSIISSFSILSTSSWISNASVTRLSNLTTSNHPRPSFSATLSRRTRERAS